MRKNHTSAFKSILLTIAFLITSTSCGLLESPQACRDSVIQKVPIYPNSQLIREETDSTSGDPDWGTFTRYYETDDSVDHVLQYYGALVGCTQNPPQQCAGKAEQDDRIHYFVKIEESENRVVFSVVFSWMCDRHQFSDP